MTIARSSVDLMGSSGSLQSVGTSATVTGSAVDLLGDDASLGVMTLRMKLVGSAVNSVSVRVNTVDRGGTQVYQSAAFQHNVPTANGTEWYTLGRYEASRKVSVDVLNNDGSNTVTVWIWAELEKVS